VPRGGGDCIKYIATWEEGGSMGKPAVQLGRELAAFALGKPERQHWKACVETEEREMEVTMEFRESFKGVG